MNILFIGDNITRGTQGVDWVSMISEEHPLWKIENAGINGETLNKISQRLKTLLQDNSYDVIVIQAGANDLLLPILSHRNFWFRQASNYQLKAGNRPSSPKEFELILRGTIKHIYEHSNARIILATVGCMNENLVAESNAKLFSYNSIIRRLSREHNCLLADISERFQRELASKTTRDYLAERFTNTAVLDLITCKLGKADNLSRKRKLHLTIDGLHLNTKGATIVKKEIVNCLSLLECHVALEA